MLELGGGLSFSVIMGVGLSLDDSGKEIDGEKCKQLGLGGRWLGYIKFVGQIVLDLNVFWLVK